jgi:tetratricopeptide (TPR) repeat protein
MLDPPGDRPIATVGADHSIGQIVKTSRALEENGALKIAAEVLEHRALDCVDAIERSRLFLRLAELHARSGSLARADECLLTASRHAEQSPRDLVFDADVALTRAVLLEEAAKPEQLVAELAEEAMRLIHSANVARWNPSAAGILVRALAMRTQAACVTGDVPTIQATAAAIEKHSPHLHRSDADSHVAALYAKHIADYYCQNDLDAAAATLTRAMEVAQDAGLSVTAVIAAVNLAGVYRVSGDPARAAVVLGERLDLARALGNRRALVLLLVELAGAHVELGDYTRARFLLDEALTQTDGNSALQAPLLKVSASVYLGIRRYGDALEESRAAGRTYERLGKTRLVGISLKYQATALFSLGDRRAALTAIRAAVETLSTGSSPLEVAGAYSLLGRISGNSRYFAAARKPRAAAKHNIAPE